MLSRLQGLRVLTALGARITKLPWWLLALIGTLITAIKGTVWFDSTPVRELWLPVAEALPRAIEYYSASFGLPGIAKVFGVSSPGAWLFMATVIAICSLSLCFIVAARRFAEEPDRKSIAILLICFAPLTTVAMNAIERSDFLILLAACTFAFGRGTTSAVGSAVLFAVANPEQGVVAALCVLSISYARVFSSVRRRAWIAVIVALLCFVLIQVWMLGSGVVSSRLAVNVLLFESSVGLQFSQWPWLLFAFGGALWMAIIPMAAWLWYSEATRGRVLFALGFFLIPMAATFITLDGVRVLASVSALPVLTSLIIWLDSLRMDGASLFHRLAGATVLAGVIAPPVTDHWKYVAEWVYSPLRGWLSGLLDPLREWALDRFPSGDL